MARIYKPKKTKYPNIYEIKNKNGDIEYLATFTMNGRRYIEKNLTKISNKNTTTAKKASDYLDQKIKSDIADGINPFDKQSYSVINFRDMIIEEINSRTLAPKTRQVQLTAFKKHLYPLLKTMKVEEINITNFEILFKKLKSKVKNGVLTTIKKAIRPTLNKLLDNGSIILNPLNTTTIKAIKGEITEKAPLHHRLNAPINPNIYIDTIKKMYKSINNLTKQKGGIPLEEVKLYLLWALMTGRRRSEISKIKYEDIIGNVVKPRANTTKTNVYEFYPISKEIIDLLKPKGVGLVFPNVSVNSYSKYMKRIIENAKIEGISGHDTRNLFLTIMSKKTKNPFLCDMCLSHNRNEYKMLLKYYEPDLEDYKEIFDQYWDLIRS